MKKSVIILAGVSMALAMVSCNNGQKAAPAEIKWLSEETTEVEVNNEGAPSYIAVNKPEVDLSSLPTDAEGYYILFDGSSLNGWRGYGKDTVTARWTIEDDCLKFTGSNTGEGQTGEGGDIIFAHKFKDFILELEWKISEGGNSGIFYLAQEIKTKNAEGVERFEPIYISSPEYQVLDNANHPDSFLGVDGNRKSASLYDMIPAKPQNQNPFGEWNKCKIMVYQGTVVHYQNDENVVEYHLWTPQWTDMLQNSKFSQEKWPLAFELLNNCGGESHSGYIGFQDHGNDVWYRNIRVKVLDK
ncbi:MAG: family 16 glycoside hydrolase [Candidatus Cryptobacteroides sp.]